MRILVLNSEYPPIGGGAGNASANIAEQFGRMGHEVMVVTSRYGNLPHYEKFNKITIHRIPSLRRRQDRSNAFEQIIFIVSASSWTLSLIPRFKPNAILAFFGVPSGAVAWLAKQIHKTPYVLSLRGGDVPGFRPYDFRIYHKLIAPFLRIIWKNASAITANSMGLRHLALAFDSRFDISVISNGAEVKSETNQYRDWSYPHLLSVGRIVHQKGLDLAIRALAGVKELEWEWQIAGDGPQMDSLKTLANELGIRDRVHFLGWQSHTQLVEHYRRANLFLFPSRHEGMPNAVLEAMANGLPVIASRISGNEELVIDGKTGFLFPSENISSLQALLKKLMTDASLRRKMGQTSHQHVAKYYSWENTASQYTLLLERVK